MGADSFEGDLVAALIPEFDQVKELATGGDVTQFDESISNALQDQLGSYNSGLDPESTASYFQSAVADPAIRNFQQNILPELNSQFAGMGGSFSSRLGDARFEAGADLASSLASGLGQAQLSNQQLNAQLQSQAANRRQSAVQLAGQFANRGTQRAGMLTAALSPFQAFEQASADAAYQEFLRTQPINNPAIQAGLAFTGQPQTRTTQPSGGGMGGFGSMVGAGLGAYFNPVGTAAGIAAGG